ncbi:MAG: hypothetical protein IT292_06220 [Deltaproteobacteria bacterium]|nr:hypothetical protein [Deltaproteobacteria bacterium]
MLPLKDQIYWLREITDIYQAQIYLLYQPDIHDQIDQDAQTLIDNQKLGLLKPRFLIDGTTEIQCRVIYTVHKK